MSRYLITYWEFTLICSILITVRWLIPVVLLMKMYIFPSIQSYR